MGAQRGRNSGITGLVDIPGFSAKFEARLYGFKEALDASTFTAAGRGDSDDFPEQWFVGAGGTLVVFGQAKPGWVMPANWKGEAGTITVQLDTGKRQAVPVKVTGLKLSFDEKSDDSTWDFAIACAITDNPTLAGWTGSQPSAASETHSDKQLFEGLSKTLDPDDLQTASAQRFAVYGLANSDAAEKSAIDNVIGTVISLPPLDGLKLRVTGLTRASYRLAFVTVGWARTTTAEDVINAATSQSIDPNEMQTGGTIGAMNVAPTLPTVAGQTIVERFTTSRVLNDGNTLYVSTYGQLNTQDEITYPGTHKDIDVSDLRSSGISTQIYSHGTSPPSAPNWSGDGIQVVTRSLVRINRDQWKAIDQYAKDTPEQEWEQQNTFEVTDSTGLISEAASAAIDDTTPPAPANPALKLRTSRAIAVTHDHDGTIDTYGLTTPAEDVTRPRTFVKTDGGPSLENEAQEVFVYNNGDAVPTEVDTSLPLPADVEVVAEIPKQLNDGKWEKLIKWGPRNALHAFEWLKSLARTDVGNVAKDLVVAKVLGTASPVTDDSYNTDTTNLEFASDEVIRQTNGQYGHIITYSPLSPKNRAIESFKEIVDDPVSALLAADKRRIIDANATTAAPSVTIAGQSAVCVWRLTQKVGRNLYQHDYRYALRSLADELVADKTTTTVDGSFLESEAFTAEVYAVLGGPAGAGSAPFTNAVNVSYTDHNTANPAYKLRVYKWSYTTEANKRIYAASGAKSDPLEGYEYTQASIVANSTDDEKTIAIAARQTNKADATFVEAQVKRLNPNYVLKVLVFTGEDGKRHSYSVHELLDNFRGKPAAGFDNGAAYGDPDSYVKVIAPGIISGGPGGFDYGDVEVIYWRRKITYFKVRRRFITTTARQPEDFEFRSSAGCVSNATFLGYPAHQTMFVGAEIIYNGTVNDNHLVIVDLCFKNDTLMHMIDGYLPTPGTHFAYAAAAITASDFYDPDLLFAGGVGTYFMEWPAAASFTGMGVL